MAASPIRLGIPHECVQTHAVALHEKCQNRAREIAPSNAIVAVLLLQVMCQYQAITQMPSAASNEANRRNGARDLIPAVLSSLVDREEIKSM